jgi:type IV secretory pathway VirB10-like protein
MSDNPKFEVIDRRKFKAEEERETQQEPQREPEPPKPAPEPPAGPRLVVSEERKEPASEAPASEDEMEELAPPTAEETHQQKAAYDASAQRIEDLIRAQNPAAGAQPPVTFEHLVQQVYLTAMLQMGAGSPEGEPARVDIVGARASIDMLGILAEKTKGNLTTSEERNLQAALYDARMAFLELSKMISLQGVHPPPAPKR